MKLSAWPLHPGPACRSVVGPKNALGSQGLGTPVSLNNRERCGAESPSSTPPGRVISRLSGCRSGRPPGSLPSAPSGAQSDPLPTVPGGAAPPSMRGDPASADRHPRRWHRHFLSACLRRAAAVLRLGRAAIRDAALCRLAALWPSRPSTTRSFRNAAVAHRRRARARRHGPGVHRPADGPARLRRRIGADGQTPTGRRRMWDRPR